MDNSKLYQHRFDELLKMFKRSRAESADKLNTEDSNYVIDFSGNSFREYKRLISINENSVIYEVQTLLVGLLDAYEIDYEIPEYDYVRPSGRIGKKRPFAFAITKNGKKTGYNFRFHRESGLIAIRDYYRHFKDIDAIRLYEIRKEETDMMQRSNQIEADEDNSYLWFGVIKDFFDEFFDDEEYSVFIEYAEKFNENARNLIGYKMMAMPTTDAVASFKVKKAEMLHDEFSKYSASFKGEINDTQFDIIKHNYIDRGLYQLITADSDYADSFIGSEWYYGIHSITGAIDETGVVTGYLKSIEQLLYDVLKLYLGRKKKRIGLNTKKKDDFEANYPGENYGGFIDFIEDYEYYFDTTLGSLIKFIKYKNRSGEFFNKDFFDVDYDTIQYLIDTLYDFKDYDRNDRLHKDNLYTLEELETIREKAIVLYSLVLGCFSIKDDDLEELGLVTAEEPKKVTAAELKEAIVSWATPILSYDMPDDTKVLAFMIFTYIGGPWKLALQGLYGIDEDKYDTIEWNRKQTYTSSMINGWFEWETELDYEEELEQLKGILYSLIDADDELGELLRSYTEIVIGDMNVIEILYKK